MIEEFLKCMIRAGGYIVIVYNDFADKALERPDILLNELSKAAFIVRILMSFASVNIVIAEKLLKQNEELLNIVKGSVV